jgi:hypothetical protein
MKGYCFHFQGSPCENLLQNKRRRLFALMYLRKLWEWKRMKCLDCGREELNLDKRSPEQDLSRNVTSRSTRNLTDRGIWNRGSFSLLCRKRSISKHVSSEYGIKLVSYPVTQFKSVTQLNCWYPWVVWTKTRDWKFSLRNYRRFKPYVKYKFDVIYLLISMEVYEKHKCWRLTWQAVTIHLEIQAVVRKV